MKTIIDILVEYIQENCSQYEYVKFDDIFESVESQLKTKWEKEANDRDLSYEEIRVNKIGETYRLLTVDSRFKGDGNNNWTAREGFIQ
ncbi:DNA-directed RNA polymerase subunit delta [Mycoplasma sp. Mirounga ES2805-ORL]|uniref:DNA-directed RNA polymerase subunit delta n=1 Tax=Mycoplasma sp. Mirounga ES2805-ORL TaxID=754514 RepID=UPI00197CA40F|nr:hypothetical protein [Mycoplasma sp. Mirounga ES2805-ORL]QSF13489.1 hypothetical protein JXZ90_02320 [Mycoplasma sp. Mirounga ES2805-ORL]